MNNKTMTERAALPARRIELALLAAALLTLGACSTLSTLTSGPAKPPPTPQARVLEAVQANPAEIDTLRNLAQRQRRLEKVTAPLLLANADLCTTHARNLLGFTAQNKYSFSPALVAAATVALGLDDRLQVTNVVAGSGAARVGLRPGDRLLMVEDKLLPQGPNAERGAGAILGPLVGTRANVKLTILRNDAELVVAVPLTHACGFRVMLGNSDNINSYGDGQRVMVTRGMLEFVRSDEELAYVVAKEMAHDILAHADKLRITGTVGGIIDNLSNVHPDLSLLIGSAGVKPMPPELDAAADRLAMYMLVRAGFTVDRAPAFWQRLADQVPATVLNGHTVLHPGIKYRLADMDKSLADLKAKQAAKKPLAP